ncbi:MAG: hypothetical protein JRJ85_12320, partial [Deltaproteobacteria bacterium]|nr:hypothetical protein [Deltaproteobacteria bacterium]
NQTTLFTYLAKANPGLHPEIWTCLCLLLLMVLFWVIAGLFFKTDIGISMRMTGNNPTMASSTGVNVNGMKILGVSLANGLVGISGGLVAQYQGFADIGMGIGTIVIGLAAVIIGESILRIRSMYAVVASVIIGSVVFRLMIAVALYVGMNPIDLKLLTAVFVLLTLIVSRRFAGGGDAGASTIKGWVRLLGKRPVQWAVGLLCLCIIGVTIFMHYRGGPSGSKGKYKIGFLQVSDHGLLNITRDSFLKEMARLGYKQDGNCTFLLENANGDLPTVNTILDEFLRKKVDLIVPISTACTQAAIHRIKDRPVVFATVANPFIIGAGKSEKDHLPNVTGVYGWVPMDRTMKMVRKLMPGTITVGAVWDPAHANSVFNVENLKKAVASDDHVTFKGATISNSSEVYQAAVSLVNRGIDAFVLSPDNIVYSAFDAIVKASRMKNLPIFISDVERLSDGALGALGYDYSVSGIQAAHLVDRVLKGENPADIPFERYKKITLGFNLVVAKALGIKIPSELLAKATDLQGGDISKGKPREPAPGKIKDPKKKLALFLFADNNLLEETARGVVDELEKSGILKKKQIRVDRKYGQNEFYLAQSVAQDIVRKKYDYIITMSTPALQVMAQVNKTIPHVFGAVTDPYRMGVARNAAEHLPNVTGVATLQPVSESIRVMRELFPDAKRIGIVWNPAEACSEACTFKARTSAKQYKFQLLEATVGSTGEVMDATKSLISRGVDLFLTSGDNTVNLALTSIADFLKKHKIPYFTNAPSDMEQGAFVSIGADYYEVGRETGRMAIRVINGEDPKQIPINNFAPAKMAINLKLAKLYGIHIPEAFIKRAERVVR